MYIGELFVTLFLPASKTRVYNCPVLLFVFRSLWVRLGNSNILHPYIRHYLCIFAMVVHLATVDSIPTVDPILKLEPIPIVGPIPMGES